ncbi:hypothetical protein N7528_001355 [Penicillium herquei]|nr:hypothetical protein N7528_001355 [Penicillium herquei]
MTHGNVASSAICSVQEFLSFQYDYIILGGGTAGLVVAARLSEDPNIRVGVIEAGKDQRQNPMVTCPALCPQMINRPEYDWCHKTVPQRGNQGKIHAQCRGKMLGGSSAINALMYVRGSRQDYDDWSEFGEGWSWAEIEPYFAKHETLGATELRTEEDRPFMPFQLKSHGNNGPVQTSFNQWRCSLENNWIQGCEEVAGLSSRPESPWGGDHVGFFSSLVSIDRVGVKGTRSSSASAYLTPNIGRKNLKVLTDALVTKVILSGSAATGAQFIHGGEVYEVSTQKEVILACGVFKSPQMLELSGIGNPEILQRVGIECVVPLPGVDENLQDHAISGSTYELREGITSLDSLLKPENIMEQQKKYMEDQTGALAAASSCMGFLPYASLVDEKILAETSDMIVSFQEGNTGETRKSQQIIDKLRDPHSGSVQFSIFPATLNLEKAAEDQSLLLESNPSRDGITIVSMVQYPASRGSVHVTTSNPHDDPAIDPAYMTHPADVAVLAAGVKYLERVSQSSHLRDKIERRIRPDPSVDLLDLGQAAEEVKKTCLTEYHPCGTCAMGDVTDHRLRVRGVAGLRVVDASIFPTHISGNIMATVYAVAEKAADLIKEDAS